MKAQARAIASFIRTKRRERKLSQAEFTKLIFPDHTSNQFLSNIERGHCQLPVKAITTLSSVTGISQDEIIDLMISDYKSSILNEVSNESSELSPEANS